METEQLNIVNKDKIGEVQWKNLENINSLENMNLSKVLTASVRTAIKNIKQIDKTVNFDGDAIYDILAITETNEIVPITQKINFSLSFENDKITTNSNIEIKSNVISLENTSSNEIAYATTINFEIFIINQDTALSYVVKDDSLFLKENNLEMNSFVGSIDSDFEVNFDLNKDSKINRILYSTSYASIKSLNQKKDYFVVNGDLFTTIVYQSEDGQIKSLIKTNNFSQDVESIGLSEDAIIQARIITGETVIVENNEKNIFNFTVPVKIIAQFYDTVKCKSIVDAYSLKNEVEVILSQYTNNDFFSTKQVEENLITTLNIENKTQVIDKILCVIPNNVVAVNQIINEKSMLIEGISNINLIYCSIDEEGNDILNSIDVEIPFSLNLNVNDVLKNDKVFTDIVLGDVSVKNKMGRELEIMAEMKINYSVVRQAYKLISTDVKIGNEKKQKDYALEIYVPHENEDLWDIAKHLNISIDELVSQNKDVVMPISQNERIVAYNKRETDFN